MTGSIKLTSGVKRILIGDGPEFIEFNPSDLAFAERFETVYSELSKKLDETMVKAEDIDQQSAELDANGIPKNIKEGLGMLHDTCIYMRGRIDYLFGEGTSQKVFGDVLSLEMIIEFFDQISPFVTKERSARVEKYMNKPTGRV